MTDEEPKLTKRQEFGLCDLLRQERIGRPYRWLPATMRELERLGLSEQSERTAAFPNTKVWRLTKLGRARARKLEGG